MDNLINCAKSEKEGRDVVEELELTGDQVLQVFKICRRNEENVYKRCF